jgi:hypothetical protein
MINSEATLDGLLRVEGFGPQQLCSGVSEGFKAEFGRAKVVGREKDREISLTSRSDPAATGPGEHQRARWCVLDRDLLLLRTGNAENRSVTLHGRELSAKARLISA